MTQVARTRKTYAQFCGLARSLDMVGDRWTLLVIRELLTGPRRYGDLLAGLPGVATNLLSGRLRQLESDGLVVRRLGKKPEDGTLYTLTPRGEALQEVIHALVRWSAPLMASGACKDSFRPAWLAVALPALVDARPSRTVRIGLKTCGEQFVLEVGPAGARAAPGQSDRVHASLTADPGVILGLASGALSVRDAVRRGARATGNRKALVRAFRRS